MLLVDCAPEADTQSLVAAVSNTPSSLQGPRDNEARIRGSEAPGDALEVAARSWQEPVLNLCYRLVGDYHEAEDCAQETLLKVCRSIHRFEGRSALFTWVYRIALNTCRNSLRASRRRRRRECSEPPENAARSRQAPPSESPDAAVLRDEAHRAVRQAILTLPLAQRALVVLRDMEGSSYEEIARITGLPVGTVRSRLHRARAALALELREVLR